MEESYTHPTLADHLPMKVLFGKRPKIIGSYRLGRTLGRGAYCKVKLATHLATKEKFAIKILKPTQPKNWIEVEREVDILRQIQHPNNGVNTHKLCGSIDIKSSAILIYIIMELAEGGELWEYVYTHGAIDEEFARKLLRQIVSGLDYCHMHLICHRDLKLENVLLDEHDNIKINDFGLSNFIKPGHSMHTFCGTLSYAAPELLMHQSYSGPAVDVWSLGVILYTMLVGDLPWNLDKPEIQQKELQLLATGKFRIPLVYGISESCIMLMKMMLQPQAKNRATLEQIRQHPWMIKGYTGPPPRILEVIIYQTLLRKKTAVVNNAALSLPLIKPHRPRSRSLVPHQPDDPESSPRVRATSDPPTSQDESQIPTSPRSGSSSPRSSPLPTPKSPLGKLNPIPSSPTKPPNVELTRSLDNAGRDTSREPFFNKIARFFGNKEA